MVKNINTMIEEHVTVLNNKATLSFIAAGTFGEEIGTVCCKNEYGVIYKVLNQSIFYNQDHSTFYYMPCSRMIFFPLGAIKDGETIVVPYIPQTEVVSYVPVQKAKQSCVPKQEDKIIPALNQMGKKFYIGEKMTKEEIEEAQTLNLSWDEYRNGSRKDMRGNYG